MFPVWQPAKHSKKEITMAISQVITRSGDLFPVDGCYITSVNLPDSYKSRFVLRIITPNSGNEHVIATTTPTRDQNTTAPPWMIADRDRIVAKAIIGKQFIDLKEFPPQKDEEISHRERTPIDHHQPRRLGADRI